LLWYYVSLNGHFYYVFTQWALLSTVVGRSGGTLSLLGGLGRQGLSDAARVRVEVGVANRALGPAARNYTPFPGIGGDAVDLHRDVNTLLCKEGNPVTIFTANAGDFFTTSPALLLSFLEGCCTRRAAEHCRVIEPSRALRVRVGLLCEHNSVLEKPTGYLHPTIKCRPLAVPLEDNIFNLRAFLNSGVYDPSPTASPGHQLLCRRWM
jgi:hypothetical protein